MNNVIVKHCKETKRVSQESFGTLFIYHVGDIQRLLPLQDKALFTQSELLNKKPHTPTAGRSFEKCFKLTIEMRQVNGSKLIFICFWMTSSMHT